MLSDLNVKDHFIARAIHGARPTTEIVAIQMSDDKQNQTPAPDNKKSSATHAPKNDTPNPKGQANVQSDDEQTTENQHDQAADAGDNVEPIHATEDGDEGAPSADAAEAPAEEPEIDPIALLEAEVAALKDKVLRTNADMENLRRRTEREKQDMAKFAISNFARDIISVDDNLNRALEAVPEGAVENDAALKALVDGVSMTGRELANIFERNGITRIDPKGEIFDPNSHQAMFEMPNPEVPAGTIMEVIATGFSIESRILRPAMVGIAKGGEKPKKDGDPQADTGSDRENKPEPEKPASPEGAAGDNIDKAV